MTLGAGGLLMPATDDPCALPPKTPPIPPTAPPNGKGARRTQGGSDGWVDTVADDAAGRLAEEGLELELLVFYDPLTETLHAVGYDDAPARYFRALETAPARSSGRTPGQPLPMTALAGASPPAPGGPGGPATDPGPRPSSRGPRGP